jgi:insecticidal toxin complex protein TccC
MNLFSMVGNRPITFRDADGREGTKLTAEELKKIGADLKKENAKGVLNHADLKKTAINYLQYKGADPERYIERIMMLAGSPIPKPKELPNDKQKIGFQLFWSTNAGARYINGVTRNYYDKGTSQAKISLAEAQKDAFKELTSNNGEYTIKLSSTTKNDSYYPAIELLEKYKNDPEHTINMMKASLGKQQSGVSYRGARLPRGVEITEGDIVKTSGFTAFSPDKKTALKFTDTYHDDPFISNTRPVLFFTDGGAGVGGGTEIERLFQPMTKFKVSGVYTSSRLLTISLTRKDLGSQKTNHWI